MALVIPVTSSAYGATYADATRTRDPGPLRKYVLAQFRSDSDLAWVSEVRRFLTVDELKYAHIEANDLRLKQDRRLWSRIEGGVGQATIVVIDPTPLDEQVRAVLRAQGATFGVDFNEFDVTERLATAIVGGTPIAYLPDGLAKALRSHPVASLDEFSPEAIRIALGTGLRDAAVFAARAHATFDHANQDDSLTTTREVFRSPLAPLILQELLATPHVFDAEHPASAQVLNDASVRIADALAQELPVVVSQDAFVRESDSRDIDHLQAADVAAGWARVIIEHAGVRGLGARFERVWVNGTLVKALHA